MKSIKPISNEAANSQSKLNCIWILLPSNSNYSLLSAFNTRQDKFDWAPFVWFVGLNPAKSVLAQWIGWINQQQQIKSNWELNSNVTKPESKPLNLI